MKQVFSAQETASGGGPVCDVPAQSGDKHKRLGQSIIDKLLNAGFLNMNREV